MYAKREHTSPGVAGLQPHISRDLTLDLRAGTGGRGENSLEVVGGLAVRPARCTAGLYSTRVVVLVLLTLALGLELLGRGGSNVEGGG